MLAIAALGNLRHRWMWLKRPRLHIPMWSYSRIPKSNLSPEENARLLSIYMRPWTLDPAAQSTHNPLLSQLALHSPQDKDGLALSSRNSKESGSPSKRLRGKQSVTDERPTQRRSYATSWQAYIDGNIVSDSARRYIMNLLSATAAKVLERDGDTSEASSDSDTGMLDKIASSLDLVNETFAGIAKHDEDEGARGFGRHANIIRLGSQLWKTDALSQDLSDLAKERFFDDGTFPQTQEALKARVNALKRR